MSTAVVDRPRPRAGGAGGPWVRAGCAAVTLLLFLAVPAAQAAAQPLPALELRVLPAGTPAQVVDGVKLLLLLTFLALAPALVLTVTSFTRIVVVLSLLRSALGTQATPPNQVLIGLALFLTAFVMAPVYREIDARAVQPFMATQISLEQAQQEGAAPLRDFMLRQTRERDLSLFVNLARIPTPVEAAGLPLTVVVPAFIISELKTAFQIGFVLYLPFLVIDMVVASTLMSMGMFMLPPVMISLPFKLLLFVLVDGWYLVVKSLVESFR
ncbi:MAG: flagellar type III secretion system pore protein FliP [Firmicutes bacterium]|nr:flagellar type III secretion system pore protein FliP [Bacillota bacterium]